MGFLNLGIGFCLYYCLLFLFLPLALVLSGEFSFFNDFIEQFRRFFIITDFKVTSYLLGGLFMFVLGYTLTPISKKPVDIQRIRQSQWNINRLFQLGLLFLLAGYFYRLFSVVTGRGFNPYHYKNVLGNELLGFFIVPGILHLLGIACLQFTYYKAKHAQHIKIKLYRNTMVFFSLLCLFSSFVMASGNYCALQIIVIFIVIRQYGFYTTKIGAHFKIVLFLLLMLVSITTIKEIFTFYVQGESEINAFKSVTAFLSRLSLTHIVSIVIYSFKNFAYGESFLIFFKEFIPIDWSWLFSIDPKLIAGNVFGREAGILGPNDYVTGIGMPVVADLYINFGYLGIFIGMLLLGVFYKVFYSLTIGKKTDFGLFLYAFSFPSLLFGLENQLGFYMARQAHFFLFVAFIHFMVKKPRAC